MNFKLKKFFWWALFVVILVAIIWFLFWLQKTSPLNLETRNLNLPPFSEEGWYFGDKNAPVVLIEYGDFECPACAFYAPMLKNLAEEFKNKVVLIYRHFPLKTIHKNALISSYAAEAAGRQGKFWEMFEKIYENQSSWNYLDENKAKDVFKKYAEELGLDIMQFEFDIVSDTIKQKVENSYREALKLNLTYTPTFFLNQRLIKNPTNYEEFKKIIEREIENIAQK